MKNLNEFVNESTTGAVEYRAQFVGCKDHNDDDLPFTVSILVNKDNQLAFEKFAKDNIDDIFSRISGGNIEEG